MNKLLFFIVLVAVLIIGVVLGVLNPNVVLFDAFFAVYELPLSILLASFLTLGLLLGSGLAFSKMIPIKWKLKKQNKQIKLQSDQIVHLKKEMVSLKRNLKDLPRESLNSKQVSEVNVGRIVDKS